MLRQGTPQLPPLEDFPKDSNLDVEASVSNALRFSC